VFLLPRLLIVELLFGVRFMFSFLTHA